jgi:uncharacterized membrane protein
MSTPPELQSWIDRFLSRVLRGGLLIAFLIVAIGGTLYLWRHGTEIPEYHVFKGEPRELRGISGIVSYALHDKSMGIIQLGIILLIATPIARVASCLLIFALQRDYLYITLATIVLLVLLYSILRENFI